MCHYDGRSLISWLGKRAPQARQIVLGQTHVFRARARRLQTRQPLALIVLKILPAWEKEAVRSKFMLYKMKNAQSNRNLSSRVNKSEITSKTHTDGVSEKTHLFEL